MRRPTGTWLGCAVLGVALVGCSIEGTRQRGDECLQDRECVSPLRCEVTPDGRSLCVAPTRLDAGSPMTLDVRPPTDNPVVVDVPLDVPVDAGAMLDGGAADARSDGAADADRSDAGDPG